MRHVRVSVTAIASLLVAIATIGSLSVASYAHQSGRRRGHAVRITRAGAQRLYHPEAISHEVEQHDPLVAPIATVFGAGTSRLALVPPPGHGRDDDSAFSARPLLAIVVSQRPAAPPGYARAGLLPRSASPQSPAHRLPTSRGPPRSV